MKSPPRPPKFLLACSLLPIALALYMLVAHWVAVPFWDEWETPGAQLASYYRGTLSFSELFGQHNEHRLLFPRLIWLPIAIWAGWDVRYEMILTFALVCLGSFLLFKLLRQSTRNEANAATSSLLLGYGLMNLCLFSPRQYETFLVGAQGQTLVPTVLLLLALLTNLSNRSFGSKAIINAALALISTYSFGNGMLLWLFAFPICDSNSVDRPASDQTRNVHWRLLYLLIGSLAIGLYFVGYHRPPTTPPMAFSFDQSAAIARFICIWIGSLFTTKTPTLVGAILFFFFLGTAWVALIQVRRLKSWRAHYPWLILGCYTLASAAIAAMARVGFDRLMAGDSRYTAFSAFFYVALIGLVVTTCKNRAESLGPQWIGYTTATTLSVGILALWLFTFDHERRFLRSDYRHRKHTELVIRWIEAIPLNPELALSSPYPREQTIETIRTLAQHDALRPLLVSSDLAQAVNQPPPAVNANDLSSGHLDWGVLDHDGRVALGGWARLPNSAKPADCVVAGFETAEQRWQPFCVTWTGEKHKGDPNNLSSPSLKRSGFLWTVDARGLVPPGATLRAWAIDLTNEHAYPMSGTVTLSH